MTGFPSEVYLRAQGAFLGLAVGDALGASTEFMTPAEIRDRYTVHRDIVGGGWLRLKPGQITDDTQMSLCIARALCLTGHWDLREIAEQFAAWLKKSPIDVGATCRRGIREYILNGTMEAPPNPWDAGNGAAMRMAPVAIFTLGSAHLLSECVLAQARLTHNHPLSDAACLVTGRMIQESLLRGQEAPLSEIVREFIATHPAFRFADYRGENTGYIVDTMKTVFHYFFATASFEECLVAVVNQGGDADTNGAIAGMIAGAFYGLEAIPDRWTRQLDAGVRDVVKEYAVRLLRLSPWASAP